ncbi:M24 family metallopeptidase [Microbacterium murale]|uniref:Xaa-Pro aminopeptidase n=1 Tax=Microbacterium murale TaxID=1081040 RepID=A0ABU0PBN4_9MICO|nr:aminopeptidase P family protein [Microbacterium murale]MDQ0644763.1 Xaa-Pro aminopeptidase [Microbacterium murale]
MLSHTGTYAGTCSVTPTADRAAKHDRLVRILDEHGADSMTLSRPENLSWYFDGARTAVPLGGAPVFSAVIHRDGAAVVTALENEAERLATEEIGGAEVRAVPWFTDLTTIAPESLRDTDAVAALRQARAALLPVERERYRVLGRDAAAAMTHVLQQCHPRMPEYEVAAELAHAVLSTGAEPSVILIAGAARCGIQHPLPTSAAIGDRVMVVLTAKRFGLHMSLTRWARFTGAETAAEIAIREVEADVFAATRPGRELREVLDDIATAYATHGLGTADRPAWREHHQGGPTGYLGRDPKADPTTTTLVAAGGAFAWNPWTPHAKVEDTVIVDADGVDILSVDPVWPTVDVRGLRRPAALDLS